MTDKKSQEAEANRKKELLRGFAKYNLKQGNLVNVYSEYLAMQGSYGEKGAEIMGKHVYDPALDSSIKYKDKNGKDQTLIGSSVGETLRANRRNGEYGTGGINEQEIIKTAKDTIERSINYLNVEDVVKDLGIKGDLKEDYKGKMVAELMPSQPNQKEIEKMSVKEFGKLKEKEQFYQKIVGAYQSKILNDRMKKALDGSNKDEAKDLEGLLTEKKEVA